MIRLSAIGAVVGVLACAASIGAQAMQPERLIMVKEDSKPAQKCRVLKCWKDKSGSKVCQVQAVDSGEMMTIVEGEGSSVTPTSAVSAPSEPKASKVVHWGGEKTCPSCAPAAPPSAVVCGSPQPAAKPSMWDRMFASTRPSVTQAKVTPCDCSDDKTLVASTRIVPKPVATKTTTPPTNFGKVERWSDDDSKQAVETASLKADKPGAIVRTSEPAVARIEKEVKPTTDVVKSTVEKKCDCDKGECKKCKDGKSLGETLGLSKPGTTVVKGPRYGPLPSKEVRVEGQVVVKEVKPSEPGLWTRLTTSSQPKSVATNTNSQPKPVATDVAKTPDLPPGMGSWVAASTTPPAPVVAPSVGVPASARNAFTEVRPGVRPGQMPMLPMMPMYSEAGVPGGMGNAFTMAGSGRPIPSDMGRNYATPNAMQRSAGRMGGAENRPPFPGGYPQQVQGTLPSLPTQPQVPASLPVVKQVSATVPVTPEMVLRDAILPSERETAVEQLSKCDWKRQPDVIDTLVKSVKTDPAATVRVACLQALARMKANTLPAVNAVLEAKKDSDVRVRQQAVETLAVLTKS